MALASVLLFNSASAQVRSDEDQIRATYKRISMCMSSQDCDTVMGFLHPSYHMVDANGKVTEYTEFVKSMKEMANSFRTTMRNMKNEFIFESISIQDKEAIVWVTMNSQFELKQGSKWVKTKFVEKYVETLIKTEQGWRYTETIALP